MLGTPSFFLPQIDSSTAALPIRGAVADLIVGPQINQAVKT